MTEKADGDCCEELRRHLKEGELPLTYLPNFREYGINYRDGGSSIQTIQFCPWCGSSLPKSLRQEWFDEIDNLGLDENGVLPSSLTTEEWWRAKGL